MKIIKFNHCSGTKDSEFRLKFSEVLVYFWRCEEFELFNRFGFPLHQYLAVVL